jgi:LysM repeat protein
MKKCTIQKVLITFLECLHVKEELTMIKDSWKIFLVLILASGLLVSCTRVIPTNAIAPTATTSSNLPFPLPATEDPMKNIQMIATQTAAAAKPTQVTPQADSVTIIAPTQMITVESTNITVSTPTPGHPDTYTLQKGEHPYCIARRFNVNPNDLLSLNGLTVNSLFKPGQVIKIPKTGSFAGNRSLKKHPTTYTVKSGDTIYTIACAFGDVDPTMIAAVNNLTSPFTVKTGSVIQIP